MTKLIVAFRNFTNLPKKLRSYRSVNTLRLGYKNQSVKAV